MCQTSRCWEHRLSKMPCRITVLSGLPATLTSMFNTLHACPNVELPENEVIAAAHASQLVHAHSKNTPPGVRWGREPFPAWGSR